MWDCKLLQTLWKMMCSCIKGHTLKELLNHAIPFLGMYPKEIVVQMSKDTYKVMYH